MDFRFIFSIKNIQFEKKKKELEKKFPEFMTCTMITVQYDKKLKTKKRYKEKSKLRVYLTLYHKPNMFENREQRNISTFVCVCLLGR